LIVGSPFTTHDDAATDQRGQKFDSPQASYQFLLCRAPSEEVIELPSLQLIIRIDDREAGKQQPMLYAIADSLPSAAFVIERLPTSLSPINL